MVRSPLAGEPGELTSLWSGAVGFGAAVKKGGPMGVGAAALGVGAGIVLGGATVVPAVVGGVVGVGAFSLKRALASRSPKTGGGTQGFGQSAKRGRHVAQEEEEEEEDGTVIGDDVLGGGQLLGGLQAAPVPNAGVEEQDEEAEEDGDEEDGDEEDEEDDDDDSEEEREGEGAVGHKHDEQFTPFKLWAGLAELLIDCSHTLVVRLMKIWEPFRGGIFRPTNVQTVLGVGKTQL